MAPYAVMEDATIGGDESIMKPDDRVYRVQDVAVHNKPDDCWLIIRGMVYDVTSWVPHHPGGTLIYVNAGKDSTQLFDSYHPLFVREMLDRFCIGKLKQEDRPQLISIGYQDSGNEDFYITLKGRVESHFRKMKVNPRIHPHMFIKSFIILISYFLSYYFTFYWNGSFLLSIICAVMTGFFAAEVGVSIQHDANHGAYSNIKWLGYFMSASLDLVGASSFMWRQQHVVGHHSYTNVNGYDPDIRVKDPDLRRVTREQPWQKYHYFQHWYLAFLYGLLAIKSVFVDDFVAYNAKCIGSVKIADLTSLESYIFWGGKVIYAFYMLLLPILFSCHSVRDVIILYIISQLVTGWMLALMFQVAHVVEEAAFPVPEKDGGISKVSHGWAALQVSTTCNFCTDSLFWTHISGGLNFQIEHHLFPGICHLYYPSIQSIVKGTCKEFNIPYNCFPTFGAAVKAHFNYLKKVGRENFKLCLDG